MLAFLTNLVNWIVLGGHAVVPAWLARRHEHRRAWVLGALPLALLAGLLVLRQLAARPDDLLTAVDPPTAAIVLHVSGVAWLALLAADVLLLLGWRRLEPAGWRILSAFGGAALLIGSGLAEISRVNRGAPLTLVGLLLTTGCRALVGCAAGAALLPRRPWWSLAGALALVAHALLLPAPLAGALFARGWWATLVAAGLTVGASPWAPPRLRRPAALAGILLAALWFAGIATVAAALPLTSGAGPALPPK